MNEISLLVVLLVLGFSVLLFAISALSAFRVRSSKTLAISLAFLFFMLKEIYILDISFSSSFGDSSLLIPLSLFDLAILFLFYLSILK